MESAVSFAPLRPADFVNFAGRGKACFSRGGAGQPVFPRGGAGRPSLIQTSRSCIQTLPPPFLHLLPKLPVFATLIEPHQRCASFTDFYCKSSPVEIPLHYTLKWCPGYISSRPQRSQEFQIGTGRDQPIFFIPGLMGSRDFSGRD